MSEELIKAIIAELDDIKKRLSKLEAEKSSWLDVFRREIEYVGHGVKRTDEHEECSPG